MYGKRFAKSSYIIRSCSQFDIKISDLRKQSRTGPLLLYILSTGSLYITLLSTRWQCSCSNLRKESAQSTEMEYAIRDSIHVSGVFVSSSAAS